MAVCDEDSFDVELEGDHDLIIASRDFERLADACKKVTILSVPSSNHF